MKTLLLLALTVNAATLAETKLMVTVVEPKTGRPVTGLKARDFFLLEDKTPRAIEAAEPATSALDIVLLLDTSLVGEAVKPLAGNLISQLASKDQMAIVSFHSSADLIQDFTSSHELLRRAIDAVKYGNTPRVLDSLYATIDGGFQNTEFRRAILLVTTGFEGRSRVTEKEVIRLARGNGVSIFVVYAVGREKGMFENLARQTGGASFRVKTMADGPPGPRIFEVLRSWYNLTASGNLSMGENIKLEVRSPEKLFVSALPLD